MSAVGASVSSGGSDKTTTKIVSVLSDLTVFRTITADTLTLVNAGNIPGAVTRIADLEHEWDIARARLQPMNGAKWTEIDNAIDAVLRSLRSASPDPATCKSTLEALLITLN